MRTAAAAEYNDEEQRQQAQAGAREYKPYTPGQYLEPIITGETLDLNELLSRDEQPTPTAQTSHLRYEVQTYDQQQQQQLLHQEPPHLHRMPSSSDYHSSDIYSNSISSSGHTYASCTNNSEVMLGGSDIDHFQHDAEAAYASGTAYSTPPYRPPPRSRSPTPVVDEEDYYVVGSESIHYIGMHDDPEKAVMQDHYADYFGEGEESHIIYDPQPPTPTSQLTTLPETPLDTQHFGPAPSGRVLRRHKTKKRVPLTNGNLVLNLDVPPRLVLPRKGSPEMMKTRYTAVTCDPDDFEKSGFFLRQNEGGRRTELLIMITMYNVSSAFRPSRY